MPRRVGRGLVILEPTRSGRCARCVRNGRAVSAKRAWPCDGTLRCEAQRRTMMSCFGASHSRPQGATSLDDVDRAVLAAAIAEAHRVGHARAARVLPGHICRRLLQELGGPLPWEKLPVNAGLVRQVARRLVLSPPWAAPTLAALAGLVEAAAAATVHPLTVNEATFMAYDWPDGGISPHRDHARYRSAVMVFTVEGAAAFRIHHSRDIEDVVKTWLTTPGDMVVLRAACARGVEGRAMHSVGPPLRGARVSLSFRDDSTREPFFTGQTGRERHEAPSADAGRTAGKDNGRTHSSLSESAVRRIRASGSAHS
jgi:alkylated DNA repair dioxygenase AlkB